MLIVPITQREFDLYALSLPRGQNFDPLVFHSAWKAGRRILRCRAQTQASSL